MTDPYWIDLYKRMLTIRLLEDKLQELCMIGEGADWHFSKGEEALSVGVMACLRPTDYALSHHRSIAPMVAKGANLKSLIAELLGRATGPVGGVGGEMDFHDESIRFLQSFQLVGSILPVACGVAFSQKYHYKTNDIVAAVFGDAAFSAGPISESLNLAAVQALPILCCVSDNKIAGNVLPKFYNAPNTTIRDRFASYGIECIEVDGCKLDEVVEKARVAVDYVRDYEKPFGIIGDTVRLSFHKQGMGNLRSNEEMAMLARRDPLVSFERKFGVAPTTRELLSNEINTNIEAALTEARSAPFARFDPNADL